MLVRLQQRVKRIQWCRSSSVWVLRGKADGKAGTLASQTLAVAAQPLSIGLSADLANLTAATMGRSPIGLQASTPEDCIGRNPSEIAILTNRDCGTGVSRSRYTAEWLIPQPSH